MSGSRRAAGNPATALPSPASVSAPNLNVIEIPVFDKGRVAGLKTLMDGLQLKQRALTEQMRDVDVGIKGLLQEIAASVGIVAGDSVSFDWVNLRF